MAAGGKETSAVAVVAVAGKREEGGGEGGGGGGSWCRCSRMGAEGSRVCAVAPAVENGRRPGRGEGEKQRRGHRRPATRIGLESMQKKDGSSASG